MRVRIVLSRGQDFVREQVLDSALAVIGRDRACDVAIDDLAVSKRHARIECGEAGCTIEDLGSRNGVRVNGVPVTRHRLEHGDVVVLGNHKMHVFDDALLPEGERFSPETTVHGPDAPEPTPRAAIPMDDTHPGSAPTPELPPARPQGPFYALRSVGEDLHEVSPLDPQRTVVGDPGKAALIVRRRDKLLLTKLSRAPLHVNGHEVNGTSHPLDAGDVIDVGSRRYEVVRIEA